MQSIQATLSVEALAFAFLSVITLANVLLLPLPQPLGAPFMTALCHGWGSNAPGELPAE
jgi:hypothetical protein